MITMIKVTEEQYKAIVKASRPLRKAVMHMYHVEGIYTKDFRDGYTNLIKAADAFEEELFKITGCYPTANVLELTGGKGVLTMDDINDLFRQDLPTQN